MSDTDLFFSRTGMDRARVQSQIDSALQGADDGELFLEYSQSESFAFDDNRLKAASFDHFQGFGLRAVAGEATGYAHATELSEDAIARAAATVKAVSAGHSGQVTAPPARSNVKLYTDLDPLQTAQFGAKVSLLEQMNEYARGKDSRVRQVSASLSANGSGSKSSAPVASIIPISAPWCGSASRWWSSRMAGRNLGSFGGGGRGGYETYLEPTYWKAAVDEALRQALVNLRSVPAPAGEMTVVLGPGWPGILLHEAIGHGLEGDFNRKKTSAFAGLLGERVAAPGVTVVDDGTIDGRRGSLSIDDEGTPTSRTVLIEDGILKGYMQDRQNARLMGMRPTGNGRRQSFAASVMPRMTNTYMLAGDKDPGEILASVKKGHLCQQFRRRPGRHHQRQIRFQLHRSLRHRGRQAGRPDQGARP